MILSELAMRYFPGLRGRPLARAVTKAVAGYERRRKAASTPDGRPDGLDGLLHDLLRYGPLPSIETLRR